MPVAAPSSLADYYSTVAPFYQSGMAIRGDIPLWQGVIARTGTRSVLDLGCGSGVLSVAGANLGFAPVHAVDIDEVSLETTRANAAANRVQVAVGTELQPSELAVMNIALDVVERMLPQLPVERAITSGYLERDRPQADGWAPVDRRQTDGWAADLLERE